ncbi:DegV family protein [Anaerotardibacter muris]|uniref:DegV family protein n=1 Tax=Anaerotardibacter muris TaxID=2941505 RepID=UPI00204085B6|nr:DegV family protein [Anaerotardibacter muris]
MAFKVVTDSCCNLPEVIINELDLTVFPLIFMVDDQQHQSYLKGQVTDLQQFYTQMRDGKVFTTSLPNLDDAKKELEAIFAAGEDVLYLGFSSALSGTFQAIELMGNELVKEYPGRNFVAIDTLAASLGEGLLVYYAAKMQQDGKSLDQTAQWVRDNLLHMCHWFTVDDLMFLYRGGRVSRTAAFAGSLLNIKPVLHVDDEGRLIPVEKTRGRKKSIQHLFDHLKETHLSPLSDQVLAISHGDCFDDALTLKEMIEKEYGPQEFIINYVDPVIGAHSGPGTLALFFLGSHR